MAYTVLDYLILTAALGAAVVGIFVGFSGALGMLAGVLAAVLAARFGWPASAAYLAENWSRGLAVLVVSLVAFGLARLIVRKAVNGLLAQPADAIFGAVSAAALGFVVALAAAWLVELSDLAGVSSNLLALIRPYVGC